MPSATPWTAPAGSPCLTAAHRTSTASRATPRGHSSTRTWPNTPTEAGWRHASAPHCFELFAGIIQDEVFGPLILFGLGGTATEVLADQAACLAPVTDLDVHDLITAPRCAPLLFGQRGDGPVDLEGLEQLLLRMSRTACDLPQLAQADFNPVLARPGGVTTLDVRVRLLPRKATNPHLRRLR